jgi:hypothetical protein
MKQQRSVRTGSWRLIRRLTVRKQPAKLINDLPPEFRKLIEDVTVDRNGNVIPKPYSKAQANRDLRMLNIDSRKSKNRMMFSSFPIPNLFSNWLVSGNPKP